MNHMYDEELYDPRLRAELVRYREDVDRMGLDRDAYRTS